VYVAGQKWAEKFPNVELAPDAGPEPKVLAADWLPWTRKNDEHEKSIIALRKHAIAVSVDELIEEMKQRQLSASERIALTVGMSILDGSVAMSTGAGSLASIFRGFL
jgi:hypothetical protein